MNESSSPAWQLARLMDGFLTTQLVYVAAKLGLADVLREVRTRRRRSRSESVPTHSPWPG